MKYALMFFLGSFVSILFIIGIAIILFNYLKQSRAKTKNNVYLYAKKNGMYLCGWKKNDFYTVKDKNIATNYSKIDNKNPLSKIRMKAIISLGSEKYCVEFFPQREIVINWKEKVDNKADFGVYE